MYLCMQISMYYVPIDEYIYVSINVSIYVSIYLAT